MSARPPTNQRLCAPAYCDKLAPLYLFFAEKPLFSVTLLHGQRKEVLAIDKLYAAASDNPKLSTELPDCDCEVLIDRTYFLPLGDRSWPTVLLLHGCESRAHARNLPVAAHVPASCH